MKVLAIIIALGAYAYASTNDFNDAIKAEEVWKR